MSPPPSFPKSNPVIFRVTEIQMKQYKARFARAVYCPGVGYWYVRFGSLHGVDIMYQARSEEIAKLHEKLINQSLNRDFTCKRNQK